MFDNTSNKKKKVDKEATTSKTNQALGVSPEALLGYMQQQQFRKDDSWKPSIVNMQPNGIPAVQTQFAGTAHFNTVAPQFVAPGYEHLRDLSIKKDLEAQQEYSRWDKTRQAVGEADISGLDPSYKKVMEGINIAMNEHDSKLRQGRWDENSGMITDFTNDLVKKKGLGDVMATISAVGAAKETFKEAGDAFDPDTQTKGIPPQERAYYDANPGTYKEAQYDKDGNYIGGVGFIPARIYEARNLPVEVQKATGDIMASSILGEDGLYQLPNIAGQYGLDTTKRVTAEEVANVVKSHIYLNGGKEYLDHKARVNVFNKYGNVDVNDPSVLADVKKIATDMANEEGNPNSDALKELLAKDDSFIAANAMNVLGIKENQELNNTLLQGALARSVFEETKMDVIKDDAFLGEYQARLNASLKADSDDGDGSTSSGKSVDPLYSLAFDRAPILTKLDSSTPDYIRQQEKKLGDRAAELDTILKNKGDLGGKGEETAKYRALSLERAEIERKLEDSKTYSEAVVKPYGATYGKLKKSLLQTAIAYNQGADKTMTTKKFKLAFAQATQLVIEGKPINEALEKAGLKSEVDLTKVDKEYRNNFNNAYGEVKNYGGGATIGGGPSYTNVGIDKNLGRIGRLVKLTAEQWKKDNPNNNHPEAMQDAVSISGIIGDTEKTPAGRKFANFLSVNKEMAKNPNNFVVSNSTAKAGKSITPIEEIHQITGVDRGFIQGLLLDADLQLANVAVGKAREEGRPMFFYKAKIKESSNDAQDIANVEKLKKHYPDGISIPVVLDNVLEGIHKNSMVDAVSGLYKEMRNSKSRLGLDYENTLNNISLSYGATSGVNMQVDSANLYGLSGKGYNAPVLKNGLLASQRSITVQGNELIVTALDDPGAKDKWDKSFAVSLKKDGKIYEYYDNNVTGKRMLMSSADRNNQEVPSQWVKHAFETDTDIKAFISRSVLDSLDENFNTGGGGQLGNISSKERAFEGWKKANSPLYKTNLGQGGHTMYVPQDQLRSLEGAGLKIKSGVPLPYVHKDIYDNVINVVKNNDLTITDVARSKEYAPGGSVTNSKHYLGASVDIRTDVKGEAFAAKLNKDAKYRESLGISFALVHGKGNNRHLHLEFLPQSSKSVKNKTASNYGTSANKVMNAIAFKESSNRDIGNHYTDTKANSTAFGKFGFTEYWFEDMAKLNKMSVEQVKKNPKLVEEYAKTTYFKKATDEINPFYSDLKVKMRTFIPDFSREDAVIAYHYAGGNFLKEIAKGRRSPYEVPSPETGNKEKIIEYIKKIRRNM